MTTIAQDDKTSTRLETSPSGMTTATHGVPADDTRAFHSNVSEPPGATRRVAADARSSTSPSERSVNERAVDAFDVRRIVT